MSLPDISSAGWFYADGNQSRGPLKADELRNLLNEGLISGDTFVWNSTLGNNWQTAREAGLTGPSTLIQPPRPPAPHSRRRSRWKGPVLIGFILFWLLGGFIWVLQMFGVDTETIMSNDLPKCTSSTSKSLAKQAIEGSPAVKLLNVTVYDILDPTELSYEAGPQRRSCKAMAFLNSGKKEIEFTLEWTSPARDRVWLEVKQLPF